MDYLYVKMSIVSLVKISKFDHHNTIACDLDISEMLRYKYLKFGMLVELKSTHHVGVNRFVWNSGDFGGCAIGIILVVVG